MIRRFFALTTLFSIYVFPASVRANIDPMQLNDETGGIPKEEAKDFLKNNSIDLISEKTANHKSKGKVDIFLKFLGLLVLSYALIEMIDLDTNSSSNTTSNEFEFPDLNN